MENILISEFIANSKLQKSIADLEKLYKESKGANFMLPSTSHKQEKVFIYLLAIQKNHILALFLCLGSQFLEFLPYRF
jgi:hypothetical protein